MAEKVLGTDGLEHIKEQFVKKPAGVSEETLNNTDYTYHPDAGSQLYYKPHDTMATLYPNTYKTMTELPADLDTSKIENADDFFAGMAALKHIDKADFPLAISAERIFKGCTSLESIGSINLPLARSLSEAFESCEKLTTVPEFDTGRCANFFGTFLNCKSLPETFPWTIDMLNVPNNWADRNGGKMMFEGTPVTTVNIKAIYTAYGGNNLSLQLEYHANEVKLYNRTGKLIKTYTGPDVSGERYLVQQYSGYGSNHYVISNSEINSAGGLTYSSNPGMAGSSVTLPEASSTVAYNNDILLLAMFVERDFLDKTRDMTGTVTIQTGFYSSEYNHKVTVGDSGIASSSSDEVSRTPYTVTLDAGYFDDRTNYKALLKLVEARIASYLKPSSIHTTTHTHTEDTTKTAGESSTTITTSDDKLTNTIVTTDGRNTDTVKMVKNTGTLDMAVITAKDDTAHTLTIGKKSQLYYKPSLTVNIVDAE